MRRSVCAHATGYDSAKALSMLDITFGPALALGTGETEKRLDRMRYQDRAVAALEWVPIRVGDHEALTAFTGLSETHATVGMWRACCEGRVLVVRHEDGRLYYRQAEEYDK